MAAAQPSRSRRQSRDVWVHRFALLTAAATFLLIVAGGIVTSTGAGLAVPDWPTTFGHNMLLYPWSGMVGGVLVEHSHRLLGAAVGLLTVALTLWLWIRGSPGWLRGLGTAAVALVVVQGIIGGLRVVLLERTLAIVHAAMAQGFFALVVSIAVVTSPRILARGQVGDAGGAGRLQSVALLATGVTYVQTIIGAVLRHTGWGLIAHLVVAAVVTVLVSYLVLLVSTGEGRQQGVGRPAALLGGLLVLQLLLGVGSTMGRLPTVGAQVSPGALAALTTAHVATGALMLATCVVVTLMLYRPGATSGSGLDPGLGSRRVRDFLALTRPRVVVMVLVTTLAGFYLASSGGLDGIRLLHTLIGMALAAGGTLALNQYLERDVDARMHRTRRRPLPDGRLLPVEALSFGITITAGGLLYLTVAVSPLSGLLTAFSVGSYLFLYTPLKRKTSLCSVIGAVPGALPPLIGWAAARGDLGVGAWVLFGILFLWQIPHSLAIARLYREDYARAGIQLLPVLEPDGASTGRQIVTNCLALLAVGLLPTLIGLAGPMYFVGAFLLGLLFLGYGVSLALSPTEKAARRLLIASLAYLPIQLALMAIDRVRF